MYGKLFLTLILLSPSNALAQSIATNTIGGAVYDAGSDIFKPVLATVVGIFYLLAIWLASSGLNYMKRAGDANESRNGRYAVGGVLRFFGAGALAALPDMMNMGIFSLFKGTDGAIYDGSLTTHGPSNVSECLSASAAGDANALTCVAQNIGINVVPVAIEFTFIACVVAGAIICGRALYKMATHDGEQSRTGLGSLIGKFIVGLLFCNVGIFFYNIENTIGISNSSITGRGAASISGVPSMLTYTPDSSVAILSSFASLISWTFVFLMMVGVFAFVRGLMIMYSLTNGGGHQKGMTSAVVHMMAGVLLANGKFSTCIILSSFVGQGFGFCN